mgnify:CR=1 FL=1
MVGYDFNTTDGQAIARELLLLYLNTGTKQQPEWALIGHRVEDSSMELDWQRESVQDIVGATRTTMKKPIITQTFEPCELDAGDAAQVKIWNQAIKDQDVAAMSNNDLLVVHLYAGTKDTGVFAERYPSSAVKPSGLGGSSSVGMPIDVTFGGTRTVGTAAVTDGKVTFTAE